MTRVEGSAQAPLGGEAFPITPINAAQKDTPFLRAEHALRDVVVLEQRLGIVVGVLVGAPPPAGKEKSPQPQAVSAFDRLVSDVSDITAAVRRMHDLLDNLAPVMP